MSYCRFLIIFSACLFVFPERTLAVRISIEEVSLHFKPENFKQLQDQRDRALNSAAVIHLAEAGDYVPGQLEYQSATYDVEARLKGITLQHWVRENARWSLKIRVTGGKTINGMRRFNLIVPEARGNVHEWIYLRAAQRQGLLTTRHQFVNVKIDNDSKGMYLLVEEPGKLFIEHNREREGPVLRYDKDLLMNEWLGSEKASGVGTFGSFFSRPVTGAGLKRAKTDPKFAKMLKKATSLLEAFRLGELKTSQVFDIQKLATFLALRAVHVSREFDPNDVRFYYNPVTSKLEPIAAELHHGDRVGSWWLNNVESDHWSAQFVDLFFRDPAFYEAYLPELMRLSEPEYLTHLFSELSTELSIFWEILKQGLQLQGELGDQLRSYANNRHYISTTLNPPKAFHAFYGGAPTARSMILELGNIQLLPVRILNISYGSLIFRPTEEIVLKAKRSQDQVNYHKVKFMMPPGTKWDEQDVNKLKINYQFIGLEGDRTESVAPRPRWEEAWIQDDPFRSKTDLSKLDFIHVDEIKKWIAFRPGVWRISEPVVLPKGYRVYARAGTELNLENQAYLISYSPLTLVGEEDNRILIHSEDGTGQGLVVLNADDRSVLRYVTFRNLTNPAHAGWVLTGAVTFYESAVLISESQFLSSRSEDSLNIIRSPFVIEDSVFDSSFSDALDSDFSKGAISDSRFTNSGDDALDFSGTYAEVQGVTIIGAKDKAFSVGEASDIRLDLVSIREADIAIASKDLSKTQTRGLSIMNSNVGFSAYQKKPEFGPGTIISDHTIMEEVTTPYSIEDGSFLSAVTVSADGVVNRIMLPNKELSVAKEDL